MPRAHQYTVLCWHQEQKNWHTRQSSSSEANLQLVSTKIVIPGQLIQSNTICNSYSNLKYPFGVLKTGTYRYQFGLLLLSSKVFRQKWTETQTNIPTNDETLLNEYDKTEVCVCDGIDKACLSGFASSYLQWGTRKMVSTGSTSWLEALAAQSWERRTKLFFCQHPGNWSEFMYRPTYRGKNHSGKYVTHKIPSGEMVLPIDCKTGKHEINGFKLHYNGWKLPKQKQEYCRVRSTSGNSFWKIVH